MAAKNTDFSAGAKPPAAFNSTRSKLRWFGLAFAIVFPSIVTWVYFVAAGHYSAGTQQTVYLIAKVIQFGFPVVWTYFVLREPLRTSRPTVSGVLLGVGFGVCIVAAGMAMFQHVLRDTPVFAAAAELIHKKVAAFGIDSTWKFVALAGFYSVFHSLLEEYYWRWFVFRELRNVMAVWPAILLSALGFTLHHIIVLSIYFASAPWLVVLFSAGVAVGGAFWAWLFNRSNSLFDPWLSHALIDAGLFFGVGFELLRHTFAN